MQQIVWGAIEMKQSVRTGISTAVALALALCAAGSAPATVTPIPKHDPAPLRVVDRALVVMIGDSITCYWDDPQWTDQSARISSKLPYVVDAGIGGQVTEQMWQRFSIDVLALHPGTVVIQGGTNDAVRLHSTDTRYLFDMVEAAQATGARVIVANLLPDGYHADYTTNQNELAAWRRAIMEGAAAYGYEVADYYPAMILPNGRQNTSLFSEDRVHPASAGYDVMWSVLKPLIPRETLDAPRGPIKLTNNGTC
jgi:lysophospholipase L1-like esterase